MAYFHCLIGGGSSGGGYELTVTCDADFEGTTITCTDGVTTLTQTCPSASPYEVVFEIPNGGDWTISGVYQSETVSTQINIPESVALEIVHTPQGLTVTPTDDIQTWLACANITDKSYTTLAEVLADRETFETLIADSNACDYMARSTTWAYKGLVTAMTSNTTPEGECFASSVHTDVALGSQAWNAFDRNFDKAWHANPQQAFPQSVGYKFTSATEVKGAKARPLVYLGNSRLKQYKYQASNDNSTWVDVTEVLTADNQTTGTKMTQTDCYAGSWVETAFTKNIGSYLYYRLVVNSVWDSNKACIVEVQFYSDADITTADITTNQDTMALIGKYDYCSYVLRNNTIWNTAINNSSYASYIPSSPSGNITNTHGVIHSATGDTVYYINGQGQQVSIDASDFDFSSLDEGTYTFGSTTAKDPTNLSNDYTKQFRITKSPYGGTTELYLMPDAVKTLYWWGYESDNLEDCTSANGWTASGETYTGATHNVNDIYLKSSSGTDRKGIASSNKITANTLNAIIQGTDIYNSGYGFLGINVSKTGNPTNSTSINSSSKTKYTISSVSDSYAEVISNATRGNKVFAFWYE